MRQSKRICIKIRTLTPQFENGFAIPGTAQPPRKREAAFQRGVISKKHPNPFSALLVIG